MTDVTVGSTTLSITGEPGKLTIGEWFFSFSITSETDALNLGQAIGAELKKAWPDLEFTISAKGTNNA
jgi:hypothetical protein